MTPNWLFQLMWYGAGIGGGGALWYFLSERNYHAAVWTGFGTGVVLLLAVALTLRDDLVRSEQRPATVHASSAPEPTTAANVASKDLPSAAPRAIEPSALTVKGITDEINSAPPYQSDAVAMNFQGIHVNWEGKIWDIKKPIFSKPKSNDVEVQIQPGESLHSIHFTVSLDKYPQFKILRRGDKIRVLGTIKSCSGPGLYVALDAADITFPK